LTTEKLVNFGTRPIGLTQLMISGDDVWRGQSMRFVACSPVHSF